MAETKKKPIAATPAKKDTAAPALPPPGTAAYKAMVLRGQIKE